MAQYREGQKLQGSDGNVYVVVNGIPVPANTPSAPPSSIVPPNPVRAARDAQDQARKDAAEARAAQQGSRADQQLGLASQATALAAAKADREAREWSAKFNPDGTPKAAAMTDAQLKTKENADAKLKAARAVQRSLADMREIYNRSFKGAGPVQSVREMLPTADAERFKAIARDLRADLKPLIRGPSEGTFTEGDQKLLDELIPDPRSFDASNEQTFLQLERRVNDTLQQFGSDVEAGKSEQRADNEVPDPTTGAAVKPPANDPSPDYATPENGAGLNLSATNGGVRETYDARTSAQVDAMINAGASKPMIDAVLKRQGLPGIVAGDLVAAKQWMKANPGKKYFGSNVTRTEDLNAGQRALANPAVAPLAAGAGQYANMATAGLVGALAGEDGQGALDAAAALNPTASAIGGIGGSITGMLGAEAAIAARAGTKLAAIAPRIADAVYGGALGFNTAREGEGLEGAATGAIAGGLSGWAGQRGVQALGRGARGVQNANVGYLQSQGVPLTVGQAVGGSGRLGATIKNVEDALTSIPGVSSVINARRTEGLEGFNRAAMQQAGAPAGIPVNSYGSQGMQELRSGIGPAYDAALGGARIDMGDPAFLEGIEGLVASAERIPPVNGAREAAATALISRITDAAPDGVLTGRQFQEAYRGLGRTARERASSDYGYEIGNTMRQGQDMLAGALDDQNPGALEAFRNANSVNRNANIIAQALGVAKNQGDELFTPAQINTADAMAAKRLEGPMSSAAGDRPFFDLARAGQEVLPSKLPDSGTATRGLIGAGLAGGIGGEGLGSLLGADRGSGGTMGLGATLMLAVGGSKAAQKAMVDILTRRPEMAKDFGNILLSNARFGGSAGAGAGTMLAVGP